MPGTDEKKEMGDKIHKALFEERKLERRRNTAREIIGKLVSTPQNNTRFIF